MDFTSCVVDPEGCLSMDTLESIRAAIPESARDIRLNLQAVMTGGALTRSEEHTSELQSRENLVCRLLLEKKKRREEFYP